MSETIELDESHSYRNPQTALLICLENDNFEEFQHNLDENKGVSIDVNHPYEEADNKSLLEIACSCKHKSKFVELLLQYGANVNLLNQFNGKAPIHLAVLHSDYRTLKLLVENENTEVNKPDTSGHTALYLASQQGRDHFVNLIQQHKDFEGYENDSLQTSINIDPKEAERSQTQDPDYPHPTNSRSIGDNADLLQKKEGVSSEERLMELLQDRNYEAFASEVNENNVRQDKNALRFTYLQYACKFGLTSFVKLLLDLKVDPDEISLESKNPPIMLAAYNRHYEIVKMLAETGNINYHLVSGYKILHRIFFAEMTNDSPPGESHCPIFGRKHQDFYKCLEYLLTNLWYIRSSVNSPNNRGETVLHYAILADNRDIIQLLVEKGAYIGITSSIGGEMPVKFMKAATLEYCLDMAISSEEHSLRRDHRIILKYNLLVMKIGSFPYPTETKLLVAISQVPHLRPLLKHPLITAFLDLKWYLIINKLTLLNYFFYTLFVLFLSFHLLIDYVPIRTESIVQNNITICSQNETSTASQNKPNMCIEKQKLKVTEIILWYIVLILNSILFLRESLQFVIHSNSNKYRYIKNLENWMEVALIVITFVILFAPIYSTENRSRLSVTAIFLSWIELMFLILSHPILSVQITMFKAVAWNSFKFLSCYLILIVAFALSFHLLFKDTIPEFKHIAMAIFKTSVMSTGEYDLSNNRFNNEFGIRHLLFILFIFLVPIVLFNLLNGVAISDIQGIRNNAELVSTVARIKFIVHIEEIFQDLAVFIKRHKMMHLVQQALASHKRLRNVLTGVANLSALGEVYISPNQNNAVSILTNKPEVYEFMPIVTISASTIEAIKEKLSQRAGHLVSHGQGIPEVRQVITNLQQECESHSILLRNTSERLGTIQQNTSERLGIIEQKLAELTELLREKF